MAQSQVINGPDAFLFYSPCDADFSLQSMVGFNNVFLWSQWSKLGLQIINYRHDFLPKDTDSPNFYPRYVCILNFLKEFLSAKSIG